MWNGEIFANAHKILIKYHYLYVDNVITAGGRGLLCCIINKRFKSVQIKSASKTYSKFCENILKIGTSRAANMILLASLVISGLPNLLRKRHIMFCLEF